MKHIQLEMVQTNGCKALGQMIRLLVLMMVTMMVGTGCSQEFTNLVDLPSVNEFNVSELQLYNRIITCVTNFKSQFVKCNKQLQRLANNIFRIINENSTVGGIIKCCGVWMARDCWIRQAEEHCTDEHVRDVLQLPFKLLPKLDKWCHHYPDQTFVCLLPHYLPIALLCVAICTTIAVVWFVGWKLNSKKRKQSRSKTIGDTASSSSVANETAARENLLDQNQNIQESL